MLYCELGQSRASLGHDRTALQLMLELGLVEAEARLPGVSPDARNGGACGRSNASTRSASTFTPLAVESSVQMPTKEPSGWTAMSGCS